MMLCVLQPATGVVSLLDYRLEFIPIDRFVDVSEFVKALPQHCLSLNIFPPLNRGDGISGCITGLATLEYTSYA